jgi:hypothetical protein
MASLSSVVLPKRILPVQLEGIHDVFQDLKGKMILVRKQTIEMSNYPLCKLGLSTDDIIVLQENFVTAHSVDMGTAKILINLSTENQKVRV